MCRLMAYLGPSVSLERLLYKPEHSLIVQSYQPREMTAGLLNADGFGVGWYHTQRSEAFTYKTTLPVWNDINLPGLSRYIESGCVLACARSATPGQPLDLSNCQPYQYNNLLGLHNGAIANFRQTLHRPIRERLSDNAYRNIWGNTDSEHLFALVVDALDSHPHLPLIDALHKALTLLIELAQADDVTISANLIISDGKQLVASRFAQGTATPSLYWLRDDPALPHGALIASEPLFPGNWLPVPERSLVLVNHDLDVETRPL